MEILHARWYNDRKRVAEMNKKEILRQLIASSEYLSNFRINGQGLIRLTSDGFEAIELETYPRSWDNKTGKPAL